MNNVVNQLVEAEMYFLDTKYSAIVAEAMEIYNTGNLDALEKQLRKLPTNDQLFSTLIEKLNKHGKSVYRTLKEIAKNEPNKIKLAKGISSLLTHTLIEIEQGNPEYKKLIPIILEKLNTVVYDLGNPIKLPYKSSSSVK